VNKSSFFLYNEQGQEVDKLHKFKKKQNKDQKFKNQHPLSDVFLMQGLLQSRVCH
jgi:hypothetical protein